MEHNLPGLRSLALERLKSEGSTSFGYLEANFVGLVLMHVHHEDSAEERRVHPLLLAAEFEIDCLGMGKWEWLLSWTSSYHQVTTTVKGINAMALIARVLLGEMTMPKDAVELLEKAIH